MEGELQPPAPPASGSPPLPEKFLVANMVVRMAPCREGQGEHGRGQGGTGRMGLWGQRVRWQWVRWRGRNGVMGWGWDRRWPVGLGIGRGVCRTGGQDGAMGPGNGIEGVG